MAAAGRSLFFVNIIAVIFNQPLCGFWLQRAVAEEGIGINQLIQIANAVIFLWTFMIILAIDNSIIGGIRFHLLLQADLPQDVYKRQETKDDKTRIFTIGVFDNNDPSDDVENYMNAISANYPEAEAKDNEGNASWQNLAFGTRAEGDYYHTASDAGELEDIFQLIQEEISTLAITADESSVLSDTVSEYFLLDSAAEDIIVNAVPFVGVDSNGNYLWGDAVNIQNDVEITITGNKLEVTGFDYTGNAVTIKTEDDEVTYSGQKLQIGFTIKANPDAEWEKGTNIVPTNDTGNNKAGVTYTAEDSPKRAELEQSPTVAIAAYEVAYTYNGTIPSRCV